MMMSSRYKLTKRSLQLEITHKNQVPMLVAPPPKSRSFFSFLTRERQDQTYEDYLE